MVSCEKNSVVVMHMQDQSVQIAGQNYIVLVVVQQMHIMQQVRFVVFMSQDVSFLENVLNVQL